MSDPTRPSVDCEHHHSGIAVADVLRAVTFYTRSLGFELGFTWGEPPTMAGVNLGKAQIFLEQGDPNPRGTTLYFVVGDADELYAFHRAQGVDIVTEPTDEAYGLRDYRIRDLHGYELSFGHYIHTQGDRVPIERVEVPVRLERRLAALLEDLAEHKRMTVSSCLE